MIRWEATVQSSEQDLKGIKTGITCPRLAVRIHKFAYLTILCDSTVVCDALMLPSPKDKK